MRFLSWPLLARAEANNLKAASRGPEGISRERDPRNIRKLRGIRAESRQSGIKETTSVVQRLSLTSGRILFRESSW